MGEDPVCSSGYMMYRQKQNEEKRRKMIKDISIILSTYVSTQGVHLPIERVLVIRAHLVSHFFGNQKEKRKMKRKKENKRNKIK